MCGLSGWFVRSDVDWRPSKEFICELISGIQTRGFDATGYGTLTDDDVYVYKGALSPWKFMQDFRSEDHPIGRIGLLHTRNANVGSPKDNANNHPVVFQRDGKAVIVVHNGTIGDLEACYEKLGETPVAEVDSALIPLALGKLGVKEGLAFLEKNSGGSASIAALFDDGSLLLARDTSPLYVCQPRPGVLLWSSEDTPMTKLSEHSNEFGLPFWNMCKVADSQYWYWGPDGKMLEKGKFRLPMAMKQPDYLKSKTAASSQQSFQHSSLCCCLTCKPIGTMPHEKKPVTELQKRAIGFDIKNSNPEILRGDHEELSTRQDSNRLLPMDVPKDSKIKCNWSGCWKPPAYKVHWQGVRWIPLCSRHKNKWQHKGQNLILSSTHEMSRKIADMVRG